MVRRGILPLALVLLAWFVLANRPRVVFEAPSTFGDIRVVERSDGIRELYQGESRGRQTALDPERPRHLELPYTRTAMIGPALVPPDGRTLFVGLGGGAMPTWVRAVLPEMRIDVVEIDPLVVEVARDWFGFRTDSLMRVHVGDGRAYIEAADSASWDLIVLDAFSGGDIPRALATQEFLEAVRARLTDDGVVVSNLHTPVPEYPSMVATYGAVFPNVQRLDVPYRTQVILIASASRSLAPSDLLDAAQAFDAVPGRDLDLENSVVRGRISGVPRSAPPLRDTPP